MLENKKGYIEVSTRGLTETEKKPLKAKVRRVPKGVETAEKRAEMMRILKKAGFIISF